MSRQKFRVPAHAPRLLWIVPLVILLLYASAAVSFASVAYRNAPTSVLKLYPVHGPSLGAAASDTFTHEPGEEAARRAGLLAQAAVRRNPTITSALNTLALIAEARGDRDKASELMSFSLGLSRRETTASIWFIEAAVRADDVPEALRHYDIALRSSESAKGVLLPNLVSAVRHDWMIPPLVQRLRADPLWAPEFADALLDADVSAANKVALTQQLRGTRWFGDAFRRELVSSLVTAGDIRLAARVAGKAAGYDRRLGQAFTLPAGNEPFSWKLSTNYQITTEFRDANEGPILAVAMDPEYRGPAARIVLSLPAGRFNLRSRLASALPAQASASWTIECVKPSGKQLASLDLARGRAVSFSVPEGCEGQWLALTVASSATSPDDVQVAVRELGIRPE